MRKPGMMSHAVARIRPMAQRTGPVPVVAMSA